MTPGSLFNIILKVLGLFFIRDFLTIIPQFLSVISLFLNFSDGAISPFVASILSVAVYGYIAYVLIFKTGWVIEKLKLDEGFTEEFFPLNIHRSTVLNIAVITIGGLMVISAIPVLLRQLFLYYQYLRGQNAFLNTYPQPDSTIIIIYVAELIIGLLMLGSGRQLVNYIELKRKRTTPDN